MNPTNRLLKLASILLTMVLLVAACGGPKQETIGPEAGTWGEARWGQTRWGE